MLGDATPEKTSDNGDTKFYMSNVNKDYMFYLYEKLQEYVKTPPQELIRKKKVS